MIDKSVIDRLEATPIEGVAESLGMRVERHKALCPWHEDSRPSLTFNTYRNRYRCYVCDAHGGVIDLVKGVKGVGFKEAVGWLGSPFPAADAAPFPQNASLRARDAKPKKVYPPDLEWLSKLVSIKVLNPEARRFLFDERKIDPRVVQWCGLTSIAQPMPCWRYGKPFYDAPSLLIPYYDIDGRLLSVQSRYLGNPLPLASEANDLGWRNALNGRSEETGYGEAGEKGPLPRFKFPRGSDCHIYGLQILRMLRPGDQLWITEGCSDCWAMLSSGKKAIAIPSATLLKEKEIAMLRNLPLEGGTRGVTFHMYPDQDRPGERLFLELRERLPQLQRHQLPEGCKDFGDYWKSLTPRTPSPEGEGEKK